MSTPPTATPARLARRKSLAGSASPPAAPAPARLTRRGLLAGSAVGLAVLAAGCTSAPAQPAQKGTDRQAAAMAAAVTVQEAVVAAYRAAGTADAAPGTQVPELADQASAQLARLRAAAPARSGAASGSASPSPSAAAAGPASGPPAGQDPRAWLRAQVLAGAAAHAAAAPDLSGARAALLGSVAAGLRGQAARLS